MTAKHFPQFPSGALVQDLRKAVFDLVAEADEHAGAWGVFDLLRFRGVVFSVRGVLSAIRQEDRTQKPRPMGARGWPNNEAVNAALKVIRETMERLCKEWEVHRQIDDRTGEADGGIGDHPPCVLSNDDRTALIRKMEALARMLRETGLDAGEPAPLVWETPSSTGRLMPAGEPMAGDLAMPAGPEPSQATLQQRTTPAKTKRKRDQGKGDAVYGAYVACLERMAEGETEKSISALPTPTELAKKFNCSPATACRAIKKARDRHLYISKRDAEDRYEDTSRGPRDRRRR